MKQPAQRHGKRFLNTLNTPMTAPGAYGRMLRRWFTDAAKREPARPLGPFSASPAVRHPARPDAVELTWLGHSSLLIKLDGKAFLTDPVWAQRSSPFSFAGPKRFFPPVLPLAELPPLSGVILSHDHYDHLDPAAIRALQPTGVPFFCPLGVGALLRGWGVPAAQITELNWWQEISLADDYKLVATPARHFSGRGLLNRNQTLWASWVLLGPQHRVFFGGDSGWFPGFAEIGEAFGPFDATMLEIGAADPDWPDIHMGPQNAVRAHLALQGRALLPIHWGTFNLAYHGWTEPVEELLDAAAEHDITLLLPQPGQSVDPLAGGYNSRWWLK